jgi:predicted kinase
MKVLILQGMPASGKSYYAKKLVSDNPGSWKRVNKDDLRAMLDVSVWNKANEKFVLAMRDQVIVRALSQGYNVVVDDTNLDPRHEYDIRQMLVFHSHPNVRSAEVDTKFFDTPVAVCIERDAERPVGAGHVGEDVIRKFASQLVSGKPRPLTRAVIVPEPYVLTPGLPEAIMVDIDGTLAHMTPEGRLRLGERAPYAWHKVGEDAPDAELRRILNMLNNRYKVIIMSGRDGVCQPETEDWLRDNNIYYDELHMRGEKDQRKDNIVKLELFNQFVRGKYNIGVVFDDRNQVVQMWRALGLNCYQVADGDF